MRSLTPRDIRDDSRASGYSHVYVDNGGSTRPKPFRAEAGPYKQGTGAGNYTWRGPRRATAAEAAQDYCDYINGGKVARTVPLKTSGHKGRRRPGRQVPPEVAAAYGVLRDHRARQRAEAGVKNYIYLIAEDGGEFVKIGESAKPIARPAELQTGNPRTLILLAQYEVTQLRNADKPVHQQFVECHHKDEWFRPTDAVLSHFKVTRDEFLRRCGGTTKEVKAA